MKKIYITPDHFFKDSCKLAAQVVESGFRPNYLVALWRGGTPVGICLQEFLLHFEIVTDHIAIRTSHYEGINKRSRTIRIHGLGYLIDRIEHSDSLLIVDDIFDTGSTVDALVKKIKKLARRNTPHDIRIAAVWYKPEMRKVDLVPDYYVNETNQWVVFPHELIGLSSEEIKSKDRELVKLLDRVSQATAVEN